MYNNAMRKFLRLHKNTSMCMVKGELGLKDISEYVNNRMLNFWYNVATGDESKISSILYKWIKLLHDQNIFKSAWLDKIKTTLDHMGMSYLFHNIEITNKNWFKNTVKLKLKDICEQEWVDSVFSNTTCLNYRAMTNCRKLQDYLINLPRQYIYAL